MDEYYPRPPKIKKGEIVAATTAKDGTTAPAVAGAVKTSEAPQATKAAPAKSPAAAQKKDTKKS